MSFNTQLFETIVSALGRDDELRRAVLQRRWQGLVTGSGPESAGNRRKAEADMCRLVAPNASADRAR
jgi:hypothetical protein